MRSLHRSAFTPEAWTQPEASDDPPGGVSVQRLAVPSEEDRALHPLADGQVDRSSRARRKRDSRPGPASGYRFAGEALDVHEGSHPAPTWLKTPRLHDLSRPAAAMRSTYRRLGSPSSEVRPLALARVAPLRQLGDGPTGGVSAESGLDEPREVVEGRREPDRVILG
jgi:hypothetical protein